MHNMPRVVCLQQRLRLIFLCSSQILRRVRPPP
jgi:hypothetical protein